MSHPLATYLHDHHAGSVLAINLLESLRDQHDGEPLGTFARELLVEIEADQAVLDDLAERVGAKSSGFKEAAAWLAERITRLKLGRNAAGPLGTLEALELLSLGILGKVALWRALETIADTDARLDGIDLKSLILRAQAQHLLVEERRLEVAGTALREA